MANHDETSIMCDCGLANCNQLDLEISDGILRVQTIDLIDGYITVIYLNITGARAIVDFVQGHLKEIVP